MQTKIIVSTFIIIVLLLALLVFFLAIVILLYQKKQREVDETKSRYEQEVLQSQFELNEYTLQHVSQEIHDNVGQQFTLAKLHLNTILYDSDQDVKEKIKHAIDLLTNGLMDLRDISKSLSMDVIRTLGLEKAINDQMDDLKRTGQYIIDYQVLGDYIYADEQKEIIVFRILQEAISNVIKHAQAARITVILDFETKNVIKLVIKDDGVGFIPRPLLKNNCGVGEGGIRHMYTRAGIIEGAFSIDSVLGAGTKIELTVPITHEYDPTR